MTKQVAKCFLIAAIFDVFASAGHILASGRCYKKCIVAHTSEEAIDIFVYFFAQITARQHKISIDDMRVISRGGNIVVHEVAFSRCIQSRQCGKKAKTE